VESKEEIATTYICGKCGIQVDEAYVCWECPIENLCLACAAEHARVGQHYEWTDADFEDGVNEQ